MPTIASQARIKLHGLDTEGINENSPLEDQVVLTYRALSHYANLNRWEPHTHRGKSGRKGHVVMKWITQTLFSCDTEDEQSRLNGLINQVLRKTDAAVCIKHPEGRGDTPTWFVADSMPNNLVIVALSHAKGKPTPAGTDTGAGTNRFDQERTRIENKLTPQEAGEHLPPGEVTVTQAQKNAVPENLKEHVDNVSREHARLREAILETFELVGLPLTALDAAQLQPTEYGESATRGTVLELEQEGKLVSRIETFEEAKVRGGGSSPRGRRMHLFYPAPGPVPERIRLPDGIEPYRPASEWSRQRAQRLDGICEQILEELSKGHARGAKGNDRPARTAPKLARLLSLTEDETRQALDRLIQLKLVYVRRYQYFLMDRKRSARKPQEEPPPAQEPQEEPQQTQPSESRAELVNQLVAIAQRIVNETDADSADKIKELESEVERLTGENAKLHSQVTALKAAIATMS